MLTQQVGANDKLPQLGARPGGLHERSAMHAIPVSSRSRQWPPILCKKGQGWPPSGSRPGLTDLFRDYWADLIRPREPHHVAVTFGVIVSCRLPGSSQSHGELYYWRRSPWTLNNSDGHTHGFQRSKFHYLRQNRENQGPKQLDLCSSAKVSTPPNTTVEEIHHGGRNSQSSIDFWERSPPLPIAQPRCTKLSV